MGHRALVAYERSNGRYDVHYSHWGAADLSLVESIGPERPFGDDRASVDPDPIAVDLGFEDAIAECVDFLGHEAVFVVDSDFRISAYRVCWFGVHTADGVVEGDAARGRGALVSVAVDDPRDDGYVVGWFDGVRECTGELIDRGVLDARELVPSLETRLERFAGTERDVVVDPLRDRG